MFFNNFNYNKECTLVSKFNFFIFARNLTNDLNPRSPLHAILHEVKRLTIKFILSHPANQPNFAYWETTFILYNVVLSLRGYIKFGSVEVGRSLLTVFN